MMFKKSTSRKWNINFSASTRYTGTCIARWTNPRLSTGNSGQNYEGIPQAHVCSSRDSQTGETCDR